MLLAHLGPIVVLQGNRMSLARAARELRASALEGIVQAVCARGTFSEDTGEEAFQEGLEGCDAGAYDGRVDFDGGPDEEFVCVPYLNLVRDVHHRNKSSRKGEGKGKGSRVRYIQLGSVEFKTRMIDLRRMMDTIQTLVLLLERQVFLHSRI